MSDGGFLRRPGQSYASTSSSGGQSRTDDEPALSPQQRDEQKARGELTTANQLAAAAKKLDQAPAAEWQEQRDQLAAKVDAFAARLKSPAGAFTPTDNADHDRAATIAAIEKARATIAHAKPPRAVAPVDGEEAIEPQIAAKSIAPEDVIEWMAGLSKSERGAVWGRYQQASSNRADTFAVALANYVAQHRELKPRPLSVELQALATMDARRFAEWRELSGRAPQLGQSTPTAEPAQSRPLDTAGQSFAEPTRDQDHDGRADLLSGNREPASPPLEQTQADAAATRAGVEQAIAALATVTDQVLPSYDDAITALSAAGAYQLQARAVFVFRQAVAFRAQLRAMGATADLAQLEHAIAATGAELARRLTGRELHGAPVLANVPALDLANAKDPAALLQHDATIAVELVLAAHQVAARLSPESTDNASAATDADPTAAQEAAAIVHPFRSRPLSFAYLRALLVERGLWAQLESASLRFGNGVPMLRTLADDARAADAQAAEFGAEADLGAFNLAAAEDLLRANAADSETDRVDNPEEQSDPGKLKRTGRSREVRAMLASIENAAANTKDPAAARAASVALGRILESLDRRGLLAEFLGALAPTEVAALFQRLPNTGHGRIRSEMRPYIENRDTANRSVSHYLGKVPGVGGALKFIGNVATGGFLDEHDQQYAAMKRGDITDGEYDDATNHAATKALATVAASGYAGGGAGAYAEGVTAGIAARSTVGKYASRAVVGAAEGFAGGIGAQAGADVVDQKFSGFGAYAEAGAIGAGLGAGISVVAGVGAEGARFLPPGVQTVAQKLYGLFPHHADIFDSIRTTGAAHGATIRIKVSRLLQLGDDLQLPGIRPALALASADGGARLTPDDEVIVTVKATRPLDEPGNLDGPAPIAVLKAERLPEKAVSTTGDGLDGGPVSTAADDVDGFAFLDENASRADDLATTTKNVDDEIGTAARAAAARARIVQAIGEIPISSASSNKGRPSLYVTRGDGAELQRLLAQLPEVRVTEFPRGLTIHRDGSDWFFEWMPEQGAPTHALTADRTGGIVGLPPSNASLVMFYGFRGLQSVDGVFWKKLPPAKLQQVREAFATDQLLHYGHVGVSFDGGRTIYGLTPPLEGTPTMTVETMKAKVAAHEPVPGLIRDDTKTFQRARKMADDFGWDLEISSAALALDDEARAAAFGENARLGSTAADEHGKKYQWPYEKPDDRGSFFADDNTRNCATYPQMLGLCVPEPSGQLRDYIPKLKEWTSDSPIDLRTEKKP